MKSILLPWMKTRSSRPSYDVSESFTSIPPDDAIQVAKKSLIKDVNLSERAILTVEQIQAIHVPD